MARLAPFRGLRYNPKTVDLNDVIAPPYDVVDDAEREMLAARSRHNAIRVELPEPDARHGTDRYATAAALLAQWRSEDALLLEDRPALYPYRMTTPGGVSTTGIIGALGLVAPGDNGAVLPHEETLPKPRSDRLDLLRATGANLSPIWALSLAPGFTTTFTPLDAPAAVATDDEGIRHELWVLDDPGRINRVVSAAAEAPALLADGHHRFETALAYRAELTTTAPGPRDAIMALVVELTPDELVVQAIHRTIAGLPEHFDMRAAFSRHFELVSVGELTEGTVAAVGESNATALITAQGAWLMTGRAEASGAAAGDLDTSRVAAITAELPPHETTHCHSWRAAVDAVASGAAQAAVLLQPVTVAQIQAWTREGRRLPPKSTLFVPKPRTGMVLRVLADEETTD
jgi:uncharacterized protein (DUF1015 family)